MKARHLSWLLVALLAAATVWQSRVSLQRLTTNRVLKAVESSTFQANRIGRMPRQLADRNLTLLRRAAERDPAVIDVPVARGWQYLLLGSTERAIRTFEEALALEPRAEVYANLGQALWQAGRHEEARDAFRKAVVLDPRLDRDVGRYLGTP